MRLFGVYRELSLHCICQLSGKITNKLHAHVCIVISLYIILSDLTKSEQKTNGERFMKARNGAETASAAFRTKCVDVNLTR